MTPTGADARTALRVRSLSPVEFRMMSINDAVDDVHGYKRFGDPSSLRVTTQPSQRDLAHC